MWATLVVLFSRLGFTWARWRLDSEAQAELVAHLDLLVERYTRSGMTQEAARAAARQQLGNLTLVREEVYTLNGIAWVDALAQDLRDASRQLRRSPGFSAIVIATLALGIGGTTAVFSVVKAVLLAPLPYDQSGQLVRFHLQEPDKPDTRHSLAAPHFASLREHTASFEAVAALFTDYEIGLDLVRDGQAVWLRVLRVTSDYFYTLRSRTLRGPGFERGDEVGSRRAVLSDSVWRTRFGSDLISSRHSSIRPFKTTARRTTGTTRRPYLRATTHGRSRSSASFAPG